MTGDKRASHSNGIAKKEENLLRRNHPAQRMPPRQHDPAMIHLWQRPGGIVENRLTGPLNQSPAASRTPVCFRLRSKRRMAVSTDAIHTKTILHLLYGRLRPRPTLRAFLEGWETSNRAAEPVHPSQ